ncbi:alpha-amylase family protein [Acidobacterium sp. S8]|uniref:alpha-amylase family protein n=1 Tax=Acidobacterium sp. S8 TaxID=1641854 RepID=UPI0020B1306A|nr:beta-galactosidase trimerization domain-containing protein [Acidobacterium sp. S8]
MDDSRRAFIKQAVGLSVVCAARFDSEDPAYASTSNGVVGDDKAEWYQRPLRWAQLAFVEDDPGNYDLSFWLDYFQKIHVDAACLSAGGVVAFYPTEIPLHYRSKWLGTMDTFGDIVAGCRKLGMNVIARTDAHACHQDVYDAHPDWIAVDEEGHKRRHPSDPQYWITCALGPYNFDFMTSVHQEIMRKYMVDGIFTNRWSGSGMCYCEHCVKSFREFSGLDLPRTDDPQNPARRQYILWNQARLFELWRLWNQKLKEINPHASYIANAGGGALSPLDMKTIGELAPTLFADRQGRSGLMAPWANGKNGKEYRATMGQKAIGGIFSVGIEDKYRWKDSVQSSDEIRLWVADGIAQGLRPWFTKFNAKPIDRRWLPVVEEIYKWHYANESYLRNERSFARVGLVYSQQTATFYGGKRAQALVEDPALGFYQALIEARIPFEMVHDRLLDPEHINQFCTLIFPNIAALSTAQCQQIREFVERGGSVIATYETSLYDEWGVRRRDFGLSSIFGASFAGDAQGPMLNSYLALEKDPMSETFHPLLSGFEDATRLINATNQVNVKPIGHSFFSPLQIVPTYPDLPMEDVFPRPMKERSPGVFLRESERSRVVYFPGDIDRTFWEVLDVDHAKLLRNAVLWATNETAPISVEGQGIVDISVWGQKNSMTVHIVNLTNPMMMKGPVREVIPIANQRVRIQIPEERHVTRAKLLVSGKDISYRREQGLILLDISSIGVHEVIALDFAI